MLFEFRCCINLLCISISNTLDSDSIKDIGRQLDLSARSFLYIGMTKAYLHLSGKIPLVREELQMCERGLLMNAGSPIKEMPGDIIFLSDSTIDIMKEVFHQISKDVYRMNEEILNTLGGHLA